MSQVTSTAVEGHIYPSPPNNSSKTVPITSATNARRLSHQPPEIAFTVPLTVTDIQSSGEGVTGKHKMLRRKISVRGGLTKLLSTQSKKSSSENNFLRRSKDELWSKSAADGAHTYHVAIVQTLPPSEIVHQPATIIQQTSNEAARATRRDKVIDFLGGLV